MDYYTLIISNSKLYAKVKINGINRQLRVLGSVHTHPNGTGAGNNPGFSDEDKVATRLYSPYHVIDFTIGSGPKKSLLNYVSRGWYDGNGFHDETFGYTKDLLDPNVAMSLYDGIK